MRPLLLLAALTLAGCGDDTTSPPPRDMSVACPANSPTDCCHFGVVANPTLPPQPCSTFGISCSGFEVSCTCNSDGTWHCHGPLPPKDLSPITD